jgi:hypothetical protein
MQVPQPTLHRKKNITAHIYNLKPWPGECLKAQKQFKLVRSKCHDGEPKMVFVEPKMVFVTLSRPLILPGQMRAILQQNAHFQKF